jgi:hypothetical protein
MEFISTNRKELDMRAIAYTYEADIHCIKCANKRFAYYHTNDVRFSHAQDTSVRVDEYGIYDDQEDKEGNLVHPVFSTDEWQELDQSFLAENPTQYLVCGDCHEIIEEYTHE